jgi:muramoyltetrapeptide carboxypeptidase
MISARQPRWPQAGADLALAAPAGAVEPLALEAGLELLAGLAPDSEVLVDDQVLAAEGYLAGGDQQRADHLSRLMADPALGAVLAARGGFGCSRLLPLLDLDAMAAAGGCLLGFSDLTCLLNSLAARGLVTLHGPVITQLPRLDQPSRDDLAALLAGRPPFPGELSGQGLAGGRASGPLLGGNLTSLCHLLGTPWFPELAGAILFLEDINEAPYRLDRLLTQLELAGVLDRVAGVAVGRLSPEGDDPAEMSQAVSRRLAGRGKPLVMGLPFGHGAANRLLPLGAMAEIDGNAGTLSVGLDLV